MPIDIKRTETLRRLEQIYRETFAQRPSTEAEKLERELRLRNAAFLMDIERRNS